MDVALGGVTQPTFPSRDLQTESEGHICAENKFVRSPEPLREAVAGIHGQEMSLWVVLGQTTYDRGIGLNTDLSPSSLSPAPVHNTDSISQILLQQ